MLVLGRRVGEKIRIGDDIVIQLLSVDAYGVVRLGIAAPPNVRVHREKIAQKTPQASVIVAEGSPKHVKTRILSEEALRKAFPKSRDFKGIQGKTEITAETSIQTS